MVTDQVAAAWTVQLGPVTVSTTSGSFVPLGFTVVPVIVIVGVIKSPSGPEGALLFKLNSTDPVTPAWVGLLKLIDMLKGLFPLEFPLPPTFSTVLGRTKSETPVNT